MFFWALYTKLDRASFMCCTAAVDDISSRLAEMPVVLAISNQARLNNSKISWLAREYEYYTMCGIFC